MIPCDNYPHSSPCAELAGFFTLLVKWEYGFEIEKLFHLVV
jgi:hypothetical protein